MPGTVQETLGPFWDLYAPTTFEPYGWTAAHVASLVGHSALLSTVLSEDGNDAISSTNSLGATPLHVACQSIFATEFSLADYMGCVKILVERGADLDAPSLDGSTPLLCAVVRGNPHVAVYLLSMGANPRKANHRSVSPLDLAFARWRRGSAVVRALVPSIWTPRSTPFYPRSVRAAIQTVLLVAVKLGYILSSTSSGTGPRSERTDCDSVSSLSEGVGGASKESCAPSGSCEALEVEQSSLDSASGVPTTRRDGDRIGVVSPSCAHSSDANVQGGDRLEGRRELRSLAPAVLRDSDPTGPLPLPRSCDVAAAVNRVEDVVHVAAEKRVRRVPTYASTRVRVAIYFAFCRALAYVPWATAVAGQYSSPLVNMWGTHTRPPPPKPAPGIGEAVRQGLRVPGCSSVPPQWSPSSPHLDVQAIMSGGAPSRSPSSRHSRSGGGEDKSAGSGSGSGEEKGSGSGNGSAGDSSKGGCGRCSACSGHSCKCQRGSTSRVSGSDSATASAVGGGSSVSGSALSTRYAAVCKDGQSVSSGSTSGPPSTLVLTGGRRSVSGSAPEEGFVDESAGGTSPPVPFSGDDGDVGDGSLSVEQSLPSQSPSATRSTRESPPCLPCLGPSRNVAGSLVSPQRRDCTGELDGHAGPPDEGGARANGALRGVCGGQSHLPHRAVPSDDASARVPVSGERKTGPPAAHAGGPADAVPALQGTLAADAAAVGGEANVADVFRVVSLMRSAAATLQPPDIPSRSVFGTPLLGALTLKSCGAMGASPPDVAAAVLSSGSSYLSTSASDEPVNLLVSDLFRSMPQVAVGSAVTQSCPSGSLSTFWRHSHPRPRRSRSSGGRLGFGVRPLGKWRPDERADMFRPMALPEMERVRSVSPSGRPAQAAGMASPDEASRLGCPSDGSVSHDAVEGDKF